MVRVISGDTIEVEIEGERLIVGYIGVDAPKINHSILGTEPFGKEAFERNKEIVEGMAVSLETDLSETDNLGRALRYVFLGDLCKCAHYSRRAGAGRRLSPSHKVRQSSLWHAASGNNC